MHYVRFWKDLKLVAGLEKLAESSDEVTARDAQGALCGTCDHLYSEVKKASPKNPLEAIFALRSAHKATGEKLAADPSMTAELIDKLATAAYVDDVLTAQLEKLAGDEYASVRRVQLLGREYAVHLMRGLFA